MRLLIIFLSVTNAFIIIYGPQPILPLFMREFGISISTASLSISLTILGIVFSSLFLAVFSDKWDRKKVILFSNLLLTIPSLALFFTHSFSWLLVFRFVQGTLITGVTTILMTYAAEEFPVKKKGMVLATYVSATLAGGLLGRVLCGLITEHFNWELFFLITTVMTTLVSLLIYFFLSESTGQVKSGKQNFTDHFKNLPLLSIFFIGFSHFFAFVGFFNYLPFYASQAPFNYSVTQTSLLYLTYIWGIVSSLITGMVSSRFGRRATIATGHLVGATGILVTLIPSPYTLILGASILTLGQFCSQSSATAYITDVVTHSKGAATSLYQCFFYLGGSLGAWIPGILWRHFHWSGIVVTTVGFILLALSSNYFLGGKRNRVAQSKRVAV
ncbi:MFS transporter [Paenibacillus durus]|uniref:MFS transporter n=1 Tax=Paenibacillus durus ATCC 35681 TaxID=1333534 RepID=A0A0F7F7Z6_PAEDU|nr:MFS transporter [Paenibacillus durus]AKG34349.1 MFS transporter [Paenibacillus durus ATCC 35681]